MEAIPTLAPSSRGDIPRSRGVAWISWVNGRCRRPGELEHQLVDVAPEPSLPRLVRPDDRMPRGQVVPSGVAPRWAVAAADV